MSNLMRITVAVLAVSGLMGAFISHNHNDRIAELEAKVKILAFDRLPQVARSRDTEIHIIRGSVTALIDRVEKLEKKKLAKDEVTLLLTPEGRIKDVDSATEYLPSPAMTAFAIRTHSEWIADLSQHQKNLYALVESLNKRIGTSEKEKK